MPTPMHAHTHAHAHTHDTHHTRHKTTHSFTCSRLTWFARFHVPRSTHARTNPGTHSALSERAGPAGASRQEQTLMHRTHAALSRTATNAAHARELHRELHGTRYSTITTIGLCATAMVLRTAHARVQRLSAPQATSPPPKKGAIGQYPSQHDAQTRWRAYGAGW